MRLIRSDKVIYSAQNRPILPIKKDSIKNQDKITLTRISEVKRNSEIFEIPKEFIIKPNLAEIVSENEIGLKLNKNVLLGKIGKGDSEGFITGYNSDNENNLNNLNYDSNDNDSDNNSDNNNDNNNNIKSDNDYNIDYNESMTNNKVENINTNNNNNNNSNNNNNNNNNNNIHNDLPLSLVCMRINNTGGKELTLRSILSIKNNTNRIFQLSIRKGTDTTEASLGINL